MNVCTCTHTLTQTVGGTLRISKDAAVACVGAWFYAHQARGKEERKKWISYQYGRQRESRGSLEKILL